MTSERTGQTRTEPLSGHESARPEPVVVEAVEGPGEGARRVLESGTLVAGSAADCDLVLADRSVSARHLTLALLAGAVKVRDLGSRNGIKYLGAKIAEGRIPVGGSIKVGRTTLRFSSSSRGPALSSRSELFGLVGRSPAMRALFAAMEKLGPLDSTVLILGETGTGKDSVARALHALSPRARRPLVVVDCASLSSTLLESELFGHLKGAFTGASRDRVGLVESAGEGTLFLDEVGELPLELQPKLLRLLEAREFRPVGGGETRKTSARILAATHRALEGEAQAGRFRSDLYFRLASAVLEVPPLRHRAEDIPELAARFALEASGLQVALDAETLAALQADPWPGNVRELRNAVQRALALGEDASRRRGREPPDKASYRQARARLLERFERAYLVALLQKARGNVSAAARDAKLSRMQLYRMLERHGLGGASQGGGGR